MAGFSASLRQTPDSGPQQLTQFGRNRRIFDLALTCEGAKTAVQSGARFDREITKAERVAATILSSTIWVYSADERR
jgi:hypothetical protein